MLKQLKVIKEVFDRSDRIVVATDAGREGEAIHRYIYNYLGCRKPCLRLWISSLTDRAIREGLDNLKPGSDYDNLYRAAEARAIADWEIGLNATQALSIAAGQGIYSLGRVQTPTLMMICSRYLENRDFTPQTYFLLKVTAEKDGTPFAAISELRYETLPAANAALAAVTATGRCRFPTCSAGSEPRASLALRPDRLAERGERQVRLLGGQDPLRRPVALREEGVELPPYRLPLPLGRCVRRDTRPHRPAGGGTRLSPPMPPP